MGNIVKAVVGKNGKIIKTAPLYQYDYGQILQIEGIELPAAYQVHFSNDPMGDSTTSIGNENGVEIPDTYLASGETVYAWLFLHTGEDDGETVLNIVIPVRQRAAITNETPTPQQQSEIDQLISEMNAAVDGAEDAQAAAEEAADQAEAQVEKYPVIVDGYWAFWDEADEQYVKSNQKAQGDKGDPGDPGEPGDPTELIDDTTPDTDKTYSSSKIEAELTPVKNAINGKQDAPLQTGSNGNFLCLVLENNNLVPIWTDIPKATSNNLGLVKVNTAYGIGVNSSGLIGIVGATNADIKDATAFSLPIVAARNHEASFYGLAKAAGDTTQAASANPVGEYTDEAKSKISEMINAPVIVSGTTPSITGKAGLRYICGECSTLSIIAPASGCIDVVFESGSTPTVLTVTSAKTGVTEIKFTNDFDPTSLDTNTTYEINILDGEFGVVGAWT